jgi:hypothetical protein
MREHERYDREKQGTKIKRAERESRVSRAYKDFTLHATVHSPNVSMRSRARSLPLALCFAIAFSPPACKTFA